jgi:18S rRNA (guanine1575-N7)-methyltransferase
MITNAAMKNGFTGGLIVDYPNSKKAKKYYLFLMAGYSEDIMNEARQVIMPTAKEGEEESEDSDSEMESEEDSSEESEEESDEDEERIAVKGKHRRN